MQVFSTKLRYWLFSGLLLAILCLSAGEGMAQNFMTEEGKATFISKAPMNEFDGKSDKLAGLIDLDKNLLDFYLDLNTLNTGIKLRDRHMRDNYLETKEYPFAEFTGSIKEVNDLSLKEIKEEPKKVIATGTFKIHGVEKEMEIPGTLHYLKDKKQMVLKAEFEVSLEDFKIKRPSVVFYELADTQKVVIEAELQQQ